MSKSSQNKRLILLAVLALAAFLGLGYRLVDLQVIDNSARDQKVQDTTERKIVKKPHRGDIRSVRGDILATSVPARTIFANPSLLADPSQRAGWHKEMARVLAPLLKVDPAKLAERLQPRVLRYETNELGKVIPVLGKYVVLKRKVRVEEWAQIQSALTNASFGLNPASTNKSERKLLGTLRNEVVKTEDDEIRVYPNGRLAAHVLGYTQDDSVTGALAGRDGIEWNLNDQLTGVGGWRTTERDRSGKELVEYRTQDVEARDGANVFLTLDTVLQQFLEAELADAMEKFHPSNITGIIVRPRTGEILALANLPDYDPNQPGAFKDDERRNRVVTDNVEPGSTFKIVTVAGALNEGLVALGDTFDCERGKFLYGGHTLRDHDPYGLLSVEQIITKSSNIGAAKIGIKLGGPPLYNYMRAFGFGSRTGIALQGEMFGSVAPVKSWSKVSIARIPMGQGVSVTRLQMLMAIAAIANDGVLMRPQLIHHVEDADGRVIAEFPPQPVRQVISKETAKLMVQALKTVVTKEGTAPKAALEHYTVAGKTGTAQKFNPAGGYFEDRYLSSFIGFLPADNPEIAISIVLDDPPRGQHFGGVNAAPAFHRVAERAASYLNIKPDLGEGTPIVAPGETRATRTPVAIADRKAP